MPGPETTVASVLSVPALTGPPQQIEQQELHEAERSITSLKEEQRSVILLVGLTRANYDQIASACDLAIGTIRSWLSCGRKALRKLRALPLRSILVPRGPGDSWRQQHYV